MTSRINLKRRGNLISARRFRKRLNRTKTSRQSSHHENILQDCAFGLYKKVRPNLLTWRGQFKVRYYPVCKILGCKKVFSMLCCMSINRAAAKARTRSNTSKNKIQTPQRWLVHSVVPVNHYKVKVQEELLIAQIEYEEKKTTYSHIVLKVCFSNGSTERTKKLKQDDYRFLYLALRVLL